MSLFAGSAAEVAVATISRRRPDGDVGRSLGPDAENGPNCVLAGHGATVCFGLVPSNLQFPFFHAGGLPGGQSFHHTWTVTSVAGDGPRELTSTTVTALPTTRIASAVACHNGGFGGFGGTAGLGSGIGGFGTDCQSSDTGMYPPRGKSPLNAVAGRR